MPGGPRARLTPSLGDVRAGGAGVTYAREGTDAGGGHRRRDVGKGGAGAAQETSAQGAPRGDGRGRGTQAREGGASGGMPARKTQRQDVRAGCVGAPYAREAANARRRRRRRDARDVRAGGVGAPYAREATDARRGHLRRDAGEGDAAAVQETSAQGAWRRTQEGGAGGGTPAWGTQRQRRRQSDTKNG